MVKVTNKSQIAQTFHVKSDGDEPKFISLRPGESANLALHDRDGAQITSREHVGAIEIDAPPKKSAPKKDGDTATAKS
jgi:hypothetical protein